MSPKLKLGKQNACKVVCKNRSF